ncbi:DMT family transporter [Alkalimarinus coralli]|uniref:DMT family transporter n=1 Tax=Alkalimarinus coralli TaxID=2935863 RepID=UPI00202AD166|nr:DMT family transporter [Alkalimarinus coralli]
MQSQTKGFLFATLGSLSAALFFVPYKKALETTDPQTYLLAVYIFGFLFSLVGSVAKKNTIRINKTTLWGALLFATLSVVGNYAIGRSMEGIDPSVTVLITRTQVMMVLFMGWLFLREEMVKFLIPGALTAFLGFFLMSYNDSVQLGGELVFYMWALAAAFCFGISQVILKSIIHQIEPVTLNFLRLLMGCVFIALIPGVMTEIQSIGADIWCYAAASAFFGPLISRLAYMYSVRYIPVSQSTLFIMLSPVFTAMLSWGLLGLFPTVQQMVGGAIVMLGILMPVLYLLRGKEKKTEAS